MIMPNIVLDLKWHLILFIYSGSMNTEVTVSREGEYELSPENIMEEINIFKGNYKFLCVYSIIGVYP